LVMPVEGIVVQKGGETRNINLKKRKEEDRDDLAEEKGMKGRCHSKNAPKLH